MWVIHKKDHEPEQISYKGHVWDMANLRDEYKPVYRNQKEAEILACYLARNNPVAFAVSKRPPKKK
jgi:hypothetical protein